MTPGSTAAIGIWPLNETETGAKPKVAVITPYYREPIELLRQCHNSVMEQGEQVVHYMVADGHPNDTVDRWNVRHVKLPDAHHDDGNTPRGIGSLLAELAGVEYISYLDADNWYRPNHLRTLLEVREQRKVQVACALRTFHHLSGDELVGISQDDENAHRHVDTSCFLIHRSAFAGTRLWIDMPGQLSPIGDKIFLLGLKNMNCTFGFSDLRTVAFRTRYAAHYLAAGIDPPDGSKFDTEKKCIQWLQTIDGVRDVVARLKFYPL